MANAQVGVRFIEKSRGSRTLIHNDYLFSLKNNKGDRSYWKCVNKDCTKINLKDDIPTKNQLAEPAKAGESVEVFCFVLKLTLNAILRCALSYNGDIQTKKAHPYLLAVNELSDLITARFFSPLLYSDFVYRMTSSGRRCFKLCDKVHEFTGKIIQKRKKALNEAEIVSGQNRLNFLDMILTARDSEGQGLTAQEIQDEVDTFTFAENLSQFQYLSNFIKECLRFYCPVPIVARELAEDVVLDGYQVPRETEMYIYIYNMHHNPALWTDPFEFQPERFDDTKDIDPYGFIPFSAGSRNCIGQNFAMNEIKIVMAKFVLSYMYKVRLDPDHEVEMQVDIVMRSKNGIKVILEERK